MIAVLRHLWRHRTGRLGMSLLTIAAVVALVSPWLAPHGLNPHPDPLGARSRSPLTWLHVVKTTSGLLLADEVEWHEEGLRVLRRQRAQYLEPSRILNPSQQGVSDRTLFLLGTDRLGRDVWARLIYGTRTSLAVGSLAALVAMSLGLLVGSGAALGGPLIETVLMRAVDGLLAIPALVLLIVVSALLRPGPGLLILIIGAISWMGASRVVRAEIASLKDREFVLAARALGQRPLRILTKHLLPNAMAPLLVLASLQVGSTILLESGLSFLGLGIPPDLPSWGGMIAHGRSDLPTFWWTSAFPGMAIALAVITFNLLADGIRDALDPRRSVVGG